MKVPALLAAGRSLAFWCAAGIVAVLSVALAATLPVQALTFALADDALFVRLAHSILAGAWLGPYDEMTLVKGAFYPLFLAGSSILGLPLKFAEQLVQVSASAIAAVAAWRFGLNRPAAFGLFVLLALNPIPWHPDLVRATRESLYAHLGLISFALAALALLDARLAIHHRLIVLFAFGLAFASYWLTREESAWLYPSLLVLGIGPLARAVRKWRAIARDPRESAVLVALSSGAAVAGFGLIAGAVAWLNWLHYGAFLTNEVREGAMPSAYGALLRIPPEVHRSRIFFPADAAERAFEASPAARELRPSLEGRRGKFWRDIGCPELNLNPCPSGFGGGWFMWALRDAVREAQHMKTAADAQEFYARLADEINAACEAGKIHCGPGRSSMAPPFRWDFVDDLILVGVASLRGLVSFGGGFVGAERSEGDDDRIAEFRSIVGPVSRGRTHELLLAGWVAAPSCVPRPTIVDDDGALARTEPTISDGRDVVENFAKKGQATRALRFTLQTPCRKPGCRVVLEGCGRQRIGASVSSLRVGLHPSLDRSVVYIEKVEVVGGVGNEGIEGHQRAAAHAVMATIAGLYATLMPLFVSIGGLGLLVAGVLWRELRDRVDLLIVAGASVSAVATRCALIAYVDVTSFPAAYIQYLSPAAPFLVMATVLGAHLGGSALLRREARLRPRAA